VSRVTVRGVSPSLTILHTADSHLGADLPRRSRHARRRRGHDFVDSFHRVIRHGLASGANLVIHSGDLFDSPQPSAEAMAAAGETLVACAAGGVPVVILPGNHEHSAIPSCLLLAHPNIHIVTRPCTIPLEIEGGCVAVSAFPCLRRDAARAFPQALEQTGWRAAQADWRILAIHQSIESAVCGTANYRFRSSEDVVERGAIPTEFDYVACGHIHRHQRLRPATGLNPPIVYAGSPDRISFAEIDEAKGYVLAKTEGDRLVPTFVEHHVRPMAIIPLAVTGLAKTRILAALESAIVALPRDAVAQVRLTGPCDPESLRQLRVSEMARRLRPDVLLGVSAQGVEFDLPRASDGRRRVGASETHVQDDGINIDRDHPPHHANASAFEGIESVGERNVILPIAEIRRMPACCGVYAFHDADGRLLYVGKATNLRSRVRSHCAAPARTNQYRGWTSQIAHVEFRRAYSELEALLLEAELIRRHRPPFNLQMRRWMRYCYLVDDPLRSGRLTVAPEPPTEGRCFGPFRSQTFAKALAEAIETLVGFDEIGLRHGNPEVYTEAMARRDRFLAGEDDGPLRSWIAAQQCDSVGGRTQGTARPIETESMLQLGFEHAGRLRAAESLAHCSLVLPGPGGERWAATLTKDGIRFQTINERDKLNVQTVDGGDHVCGREIVTSTRLPKSMIDALITAARVLRQAQTKYWILCSPGRGSSEQNPS